MRALSLDDKYDLEEGQVFLSGAQAIARIALDQRRRDARAGLRTAGFISGYRGSPLGGVDTALWQAARILKAHDIHFEPGLNEEIAATAVAGSQQGGIIGRSRFDGVFGIWYAKNPGLDRSGDAVKHGNAVGTTRHGGVLAISGDDPGASSSTLPNQCDQAFIAALVPLLNPASLQELYRFGLLGIALSRYAGLWTGLKAVADTVECTASIAVSATAPAIVLPDDFAMPAEGLGVRWPDERRAQDARLLNLRLPAAKAFARANGLDGIAFGSHERRRLTIVTSGKAYGDVRQALDDLGIDEPLAATLGIAVYKVGMVWPLEPQRIRAAVEGTDDVLLVEERRAIIEPQLKDLAFNWPADRRPRIVGKLDEAEAALLPEAGELTPDLVALAVAARLRRLDPPPHVDERRQAIDARLRRQQVSTPALVRVPHFCAGCPHARSTRLPEGSAAIAGIGCHSLRVWMTNSHTVTMPQMGGEGATWLGMAPFIETEHIFQNLGDGTYAHSGSLGIRAAVAAKRRITFRILYNEAAAMTGGQPVEGALTVDQIARQVAAEGVERIAIVSEQPDDHAAARRYGSGITLHHRDQLDAVQRELRGWRGVSAIIYDQVCATEKRRRRKRGSVPQATGRLFINTAVCEGCGDCVEQSQCAAVMPVETAFGRKRRIDQSACNVDLSCVQGFCPSFVTVEGGELRRAEPDGDIPSVPLPDVPPLNGDYNVLIAGIGGSGVITISAILGMAAHLVGAGASVLDNTGIARKGGAVTSDVRLAPRPDDIHIARIADASADVVLACDLVTAATPAVLAKINPGRTRVIANTAAIPTLNQRLSADDDVDAGALRRVLSETVGAGRCDAVDSLAIAEHLLGDAIYANMVMLGFAFQRGLIPLPHEAIDCAIALNGTEVEANRHAFAWGRRAAHEPDAVARMLEPELDEIADASLDDMVARHMSYLTAYQNAAYAARYRRLVDRVREADRRAGHGDAGALSFAVARAYFRLLAIKDEYEVARLYSDGTFARAVARQFSGSYKLRYHLAPPLWARPDPATGRARKRTYGPWMGRLLQMLPRLKVLRGTWLDPFGHTQERKLERRLALDYEGTIEALIRNLDSGNYALAAEIAALPEQMRGYGHVKAANVARAKQREAQLLASFATKTATAAA